MVDSVESATAAGCTARPFDAAGDVLLDALAHGLRALRLPECARRVGPVVPGATMAGGARIPGTSYDLDPVRAAFCLGLLLHWRVDDDEAPPARPRLTATLGGVLAMADYVSRRAIIEAASPLTVRDVLARMLEAEAALATGSADAAPLQSAAVRAVTSRVVRSMLGRTDAADAFATGTSTDNPDAPADEAAFTAMAERFGDANSDGVRHALRLGEGRPTVKAAPDSAVPLPVDLAEDFWASSARTRFEAMVALTYPAAQANKINNLLSSRRRFEATPIDQFMALLVRN